MKFFGWIVNPLLWRAVIGRWWFKLGVVILTLYIFFIIFNLISRYTQAPIVLSNVQPEQFVSHRVVDPRLVQLSSSTPTWGNPKAKVVIVEFGDFQCPFSRSEFSIIREVMEKYQDQIFFIWRQFPITNLHDRALETAEASICAEEQGRFWPFHDQVFLHQDNLSSEALLAYAERAGLVLPDFIKCMASHKTRAVIATDVQVGLDNSIKGTPTFFINGTPAAGVLPKVFWEQVIELLSK